MITESQYAEYRQRADARKQWLESRNFSPYKPEDIPAECRISNDEISAVEVYEFMRDKPESFVAYHAGAQTITTWTGDRLGVICRIYPEYRNNFGARVSRIVVLGDNGIFYYGTSTGIGMYCRLRAYKNQQRAQSEFSSWYHNWQSFHNPA